MTHLLVFTMQSLSLLSPNLMVTFSDYGNVLGNSTPSTVW